MNPAPQETGTLNPSAALAGAEPDRSSVPSQQTAVHQGIKWLGFSLGLSQILRLSTMAVLVRLLTKSDFGVIALANGAILAMSAFREIGFSQAFIHRKCADVEDERLSADTVFWILVGTNTMLFGAGFICAPQIAGWFEDGFTSLVPVMRAMLVLFVIEGLMITPSALLQKRLEFRSVSILEVRSTLIYSVTAIVCAAALGLGVWSLVIGQLVSRALQALCLFRVAGFSQRLRWDGAIARELFRYGRWLWASAGLQALGRAGDRFLLGRIGGGAVLGTYGVAFTLCNASARPVSNVINRVAFPAMAKVRDDTARVAASLLSAFSLITFAALPAAIGLAVVAEDFIAAVCGPKWMGLDMVPIVRILAFYGGALAVGTIARPVLLAMGRPRIVFFIGAAREVLLIALLFTVYFNAGSLTRHGVLVSLAVATPMFLSVVVGLYQAVVACEGDGATMLTDFMRALWCAALMAGAVIVVGLAAQGWTHWLRLPLSVVVGVGSYWAAASFFHREVLSDLKAHLVGIRNSGAPEV